MASRQSAQLVSQTHSKKRTISSRLLILFIVIACVLTLLSFIGATVFWVGLVHDKLADTLSAIFTALGTIFGFIALVLAIPPFIQYLRERRTVPSPIPLLPNIDNQNNQSGPPLQQSALNKSSIDSSITQSHFANDVRSSTSSQLHSTPNQLSQPMDHSMTQPVVSASAISRNLSKPMVQNKSELVDKLLACPTMRDRSSRNMVVQELSFANSISRDSSTTNKEDLMAIVNRCLDFSDGLQQLVERIKYREENSLPMQQLETFVMSLS